MSELSAFSLDGKMPHHEFLIKTARSESFNIFEGLNELRASGSNFNFIDGPVPR